MRSKTKPSWVAVDGKSLAQDVGDAGHKDVKIMTNSDQEKPMLAQQHEVQRIRDTKTVSVNSPV